MNTRSSARRRVRCGSWPRTGGTASLISRWTGVWRPIRSRCPARTTGRLGSDRSRVRVCVEIAALPSATVAVRQGDNELGRVRWGNMERDGRADAARSCSSWWKAAATGCTSASSTARPGGRCRAGSHFRSAGNSLPAARPPQSRHAKYRQLALRRWRRRPPGPAQLRIYRRHLPGMAATRQRCRGCCARVRIRAAPADCADRAGPARADAADRARRLDMAAEGWWSGDSHVHFLSTPGAQLEQRGEDLRVVNLLQTQWGALFHQYRGFLRPAQCRRRRRLRDVCRPGKPAARARPHGPVGPERAGHAVV